MTDYWTEDSLPPLASPQRVLWRGAVAVVSLLGVGFGLGWVAAWQQPDQASASQTCPLQPGPTELRAVAIEVKPMDGEPQAKIDDETTPSENAREPQLPTAKATPIESDEQY